METFEQFDADSSGAIDWQEFDKIMRAFDRKFTLHLTDREIVTLFKESDTDRSGAINFKCAPLNCLRSS
jgi:Ca2+-binding EF-hand superfamily protein